MAKEKTTLERTNWWEEGMTSKMMLENLRRRAEMRWEHSAEQCVMSMRRMCWRASAAWWMAC